MNTEEKHSTRRLIELAYRIGFQEGQELLNKDIQKQLQEKSIDLLAMSHDVTMLKEELGLND